MATRKNKHPLAHLIPPKEFADEYVSRVINGVRDLALMRYAREAGRNLMLFGPTGSAKTSLILAFAAEEQIPVVTIQCADGLDPTSFWGQPAMDEGGKVFFQYSEVTELLKAGNGVLYLDEPNFMPPKITGAFHSVLDKRRQATLIDNKNEVIHMADGVLVTAAYNPEYEGTRPLYPAFKNRFSLKVNFDYDPNVEKKLFAMPVTIELARKLRDAHRNGVIDTPIPTNMFMEFEEFCIDLGADFAIENMLSTFNAAELSAVRELVELHRARITAEVSKMEESLAE